jgi:amidophosphoribosyltransferase
MVTPENIEWQGEVEIIFQTIENLHTAIDGPCGDWYFTGYYPTTGGIATVNAAYINWFDGVTGRSYDLPL